MTKLKHIAIIGLAGFFLALPAAVSAATEATEGGHHAVVSTLLWIAVILLAAKLSGLVERLGQPAVLGELVMGVMLGNLFLVGISWFEPIKTDAFVPFLAELGVILLLFQVGLESNIAQMRKVGGRAFGVATVGVVAPFVLGTFLVGPWLMPGLSQAAYLFMGAALTATSVGITARVFKDLGKLKLPEAQIVLGAAVIDDVMGLIILAVVSAIATIGAISFGGVAWIIAKAVLFLAGSIAIGHYSAPLLGRGLSRIHTGTGMKFTLAIAFAFVFAGLAGLIGLAPIVGAFAAGLVLDPVHFRHFSRPPVVERIRALNTDNRTELSELADHYEHKHVEDLIEPLAMFFVPIFFVYTGLMVDLQTLFNPQILGVALGITAVAVVGKYISGFAAGPVNKHLVGFGMVPRGEVGLIFATIGASLGVVTPELFSVIVIMVILTTLLTPPILTHLLKRGVRA